MRRRGATNTNGNWGKEHLVDIYLADLCGGGIRTWDGRYSYQEINVEILKIGVGAVP